MYGLTHDPRSQLGDDWAKADLPKGSRPGRGLGTWPQGGVIDERMFSASSDDPGLTSKHEVIAPGRTKTRGAQKLSPRPSKINNHVPEAGAAL